jgi:succinate dehydrogenase / fumarate reductase flavoprotein subunit
MSKVHPVRSHSNAAAGGINAALNVDDSWESHAFDTVKGSDYLGDQDAIEIMCREAPDEVLWLEHQGVTFHRNDEGKLGTRAFGGASAARTYYVADITGQALLHVLYEQLMKNFESGSTATRSGSSPRCCRTTRAGASARSPATSATARCRSSTPRHHPRLRRRRPVLQADHERAHLYGDGIAQSYRLGAPLMDMEMIQYHPTTLAGNGILITEGARGEGAHLYNAQGERFMEKYAPNKLELASRDVVSRSEQTEINEGRGFPDGTVALDITKVPRKRTLEALREIVNIGRDFAGVDITREPDPHQAGLPLHHGRRQDRRVGRDLDPGPLRGRRGRLRLGPRRQPPGRELPARHAHLRPPLGRARRGAAPGHGDARPSEASLADEQRMIDEIIGRERGVGRRVSEIKDELGDDDELEVRGVPRRGGLTEAHEIVRRLKEEARPPTSTTAGTVFNQDVLGAIELGYMLDCAEAIVDGRARAQGVARGAVPAGLPAAQRRRVAQAHQLSANGGDVPKISTPRSP